MSIATEEHAVLDGVPTDLYIGGEWRPASGGDSFAVEDPATGKTLCEIADATPGGRRGGARRRGRAQPEWAATPPNERGEILWRAFEALRERADELALLMTLEMGKSVAESKARDHLRGRVLPLVLRRGAADRRQLQDRRQQRRAGCSSCASRSGRRSSSRPWNFPTAMGTRKIGPAIAAGCTMVWKPAQLTPLSALALTKILEEAGLPPGVLNIVTSSSSSSVAAPVIADPRLRKLSFTGLDRGRAAS